MRFTWHDALLPRQQGVVAAIRWAFSISRKPFTSYDFHRQVVELVYTYLELFPPDSAEFLARHITIDQPVSFLADFIVLYPALLRLPKNDNKNVDCSLGNLLRTCILNTLGPRFNEDLEEVAWDLGLPRSTSAEDVHCALKQKAEEITHAQEVWLGSNTQT